MDPPIAYTGAITGYLIQSALYCEYKPYIEAKKQTRITPGLARRIVQRTLETIKQIPRVGKAYVKLTLAGEIMGYPAITTPDAVYFENARPKAIIRGKIRPNLRDYPGDWAVLALASLLLGQITGRDPDTIVLALALARDEEALREAVWKIKNEGPKPAKNPAYTIKTRILGEDEILRLLARPVRLLVGLVQPRPPAGNKCSACSLRTECPYRLV
ncbi:MAG: hypothetical protein F7C33_04365 [Desulfurococcales archaeon]|nr:hypothetical protein [Desulfurococcales archaeon]